MFGIEMVRTYEATCDYCGESYKEGSTNNDNKTFTKKLIEMGWVLTKKRNYCSKKHKYYHRKFN